MKNANTYFDIAFYLVIDAGLFAILWAAWR